MASGSVGPTNAGYNQNAGGYYITLENIASKMLTYTPGSGSGGSWAQGTFAAYTWGGAGSDATVSTLVAQNGIIRDMGKSEVSAGLTFRKFQAVGPASVGTNGVFGSAATSSGGYYSNPGYLTFYLAMTSDGKPGSVPLIARYA